jgi:hypothetical protein
MMDLKVKFCYHKFYYKVVKVILTKIQLYKNETIKFDRYNYIRN